MCRFPKLYTIPMRAGRHDRAYGVKDVIHTIIYINCLKVRFGLFPRRKHMHVIAFHREDRTDHFLAHPLRTPNAAFLGLA